MFESTTGPTIPGRIRVALAASAIALGGLGSIAGSAIILYVLFFTGRTEGDAMFAGAGVVLLVVALPLLAVGLLFRPRRRVNSAPHDPAA